MHCPRPSLPSPIALPATFALPAVTVLIALIVLLSPVAAVVAQGSPSQIEELDLDESQTLAVEAQKPAIDLTEIQTLYSQAEEVFRSADQPASLTLFGQVVDLLEAHRATTGLDAEADRLLSTSIAYRAQVHFNLDEAELVDQDLRHMLAINANADLDRESVSPKLVERFEDLRKEMVGEVTFILDPPDAEVLVDGYPVDALSGAVGILAGTHAITARRAGYGGIERELQVDAGSALSLDLLLLRESAVLRLNTRPREAEVRLDGAVVGRTSGTAADGFLPEGAASIYRRDEFSSELVLAGIEPGLKTLEVMRQGYRPYRVELDIFDLIDFSMPPIVLEAESGKLSFNDFPRGAEILVNGKVTRPDVAGTSRPQVTLPPGEYQVAVAAGASRMFSTRLRLADRQTIEVDVQMRPGLAFLGVLGNDKQTVNDLQQSLRQRLTDANRWTLVDRSRDAAATLKPLGLTAERLRQAQEGGSVPEEIDWRAVQRAVDRDLPGLVYVLAVLGNDLMATEATLWIWPAAPGPAIPDRLTLPLGDVAAVDEMRDLFNRPVLLRRPWVGALLVDSDAEPHPVVVDVTPASPASAAGLQVGDQVLGIGGYTISSRADFEARLAAAETGETFDLALQSPALGSARQVKLTLGSSPLILDSQSANNLASVTYTQLVLMEERARPEEKWVIRLNQALILIGAGENEEAVRRLRDLDSPSGTHGVGRATVDYWLGLALSRVGPRYQDTARSSLESAAGSPGGRLLHNDEAFIEPRARARLLSLSGGGR